MQELAHSKVLVLGLGISGRSAANFCAARGAEVVAADERGEAEIDGLEEVTDSVYIGSMVSSDPRLTGTYTSTDNYIVDTTEMLDDFSNFNVVVASSWELTNDGGSWLVDVTSFGNIEAAVNAGWLEFVGQGGYEGLTAYSVADWLDSPQFVGTIVTRPIPEVPEPYAAE